MAEFLNKDGLRFLLERLVEIIDQKTQINIVSDIDENSTNQQIPGAKAVYDLLTDALSGITKLKTEVIATLPATGEANVVYLVQGSDGTYTQYIYTGDQWINLGKLDIDLSEFWARDDLEALTNTEIQEIIDDVMGV